MKRIFATAGLALWAVFALAQVDPNRTVAVVNGEEIKGDEYYRRMEHLPDVGRMIDTGKVIPAPPGFLTISQLIDARLVLQLAKARNVYPTDDQVSQLLQDSISADPDLEKRWLVTGQSEADLKYQFAYQAAKFNLQTEGISVAQQEVEARYKQSPPTLPKSLKLRVIAVASDADEKAVDADLAAGKSFGEVAKTRSLDRSQANSGDIGSLPITALTKDVQDALAKVKIGETTTWIDKDNYHLKYLKEEVIAEKQLPLDALMRTQMRRQIMWQKGMVKNDVEKELNDFRAKANVEIKAKEFADMYQQFMKAFLKG